MAEKNALKDSLTCSQCQDTFREPVTLGCNHSFCCSCLQNYRDQSGIRNCPVCRRRWSGDFPLVNFALKQVADAFAGRQETGLSEKLKSEGKEEAVCSHAEGQSLFCKDEGRLLCSVCEFYHHQRHTVVKVEEAEKELKEQLKSELETLSKQREEHKQLDKLYEEITQHSKKQTAQCESQIKAVFNRLHHFLKQEEQRAVEALREEQQRQAQTMSPELGRVRQQLASVDRTIQDVKELLQTDTKAFLKTYNKTQRQVKVQTSQSNPKPASGLLIDQAKVLGNLGFRVWSRSEVSYSPVILDPNTAHSCLYLSEDLRGVTKGDTYQKVPDNPERHSKYTSVLASEGFSSGVHQWDVEVGDLPRWVIGVAKESVDRKGERTASPENGIWCLWHGEGRYNNGCGKTFSVEKAPEKIRVKLNYDLGEVSFYDADHMTHLYTHKDTFTEKLFPYFSVGKDKDAKTKEIRICPSEASQSSPE